MVDILDGECLIIFHKIYSFLPKKSNVFRVSLTIFLPHDVGMI